MIRIYHGGALLVSYERRDHTPGLSTKEHYTAENHLGHRIFEPEQKAMLTQWASHIGSNVVAWVKNCMLSSHQSPQMRNRLIYGMLSVPQGHPELYDSFNDTLERFRLELGHYPTIGQMKQAMQDALKADGLTEDPIYTPKRHHEIAKDHLLGKRRDMSWPNSTPPNALPAVQYLDHSGRFDELDARIRQATDNKEVA